MPVDLGVAPAWRWMPEHAQTLGPEVADLCDLAGFPPDPDQRLALDLLFARTPDMRVAVFEMAMVAARQNLKTGWLKQAALGWLYVTQERLVVWSAHEFGTAQEAFRDMVALIESCPDLDREVKMIHRGNGDEAIELTGDRRLRFKARTKAGGRGLTGNKVVLDEAMFLRPVHMGALLPTLSAVVDPQVVYAASAGLVDSDVLRGVRDRGRAGGDPSLAYLEWGDPLPASCGVEDCDHRLGSAACSLDDRDRWRSANPALGRRISEDYIAAERRALPADEFARERLGWWDEPAAEGTDLPLATWAALGNPDAAPVGRLTVGADVAPGHASSSVYVFGSGAIPVGELVVRANGSSWLVDRLASMVARHDVAAVAVDPSGPIGSLVPAMQAANLPLALVEGKESVRACGSFAASAADGAFRHRAEPEMAAAVAGARRRSVGDAWKWSRKDSTVDITGLVAATNALWAQRSAPSGAPEIHFL